MKSGDRVPSEVQVSGTLKISRGVVREAYKTLGGAGIIAVAAGKFPRVGELDDSLVTNLIRHGISTRQVSPEHVLDFMCSFEVRAAELASRQRTEEELQEMRHAVSGMRRALDDSELFFAYELLFHTALARAAGNPLFPLIGNAMRESIKQSISMGQAGGKSRPGLRRILLANSAVMDAIQSSKAAQARKRMQLYFDEARSLIRP